MPKDTRDLVPHNYDILPPARTTRPLAPAPQMPALPSSGGIIDRWLLDRRRRHVETDTDFIKARIDQSSAFTALIRARIEAERALFELDRLGETLQDEYELARARRQYEHEITRIDHEMACQQRQNIITETLLAREAAVRAHARDTEHRDVHHQILMTDAQVALTKTRNDLEALSKPAPTPAAAPDDPMNALRAALNLARSRGDHDKARQFETALAALAPRLARTGS
jgi:hypothetical protein